MTPSKSSTKPKMKRRPVSLRPVAPLPLVPPLARLETHAHGGWLIGAFSHQGAGHAANGEPNQDAFRIAQFGTATVVAVADGVSTKPFGTLGANYVVERVVCEVDHLLTPGKSPDAHLLTAAIETTRDDLANFARRAGKPVSDFATTLQVAILTARTVTVAKIGDGALVGVEHYRDGAALVPLLDTPHVGPGVLELTHSAWRAHLRVRHMANRTGVPVSTLAIASDGAVPYFLKAATAQNGPEAQASLSPTYIDSEFRRQLDARGPRNLIGYFAQLIFLKNHIDEPDDKTLVVAVHQGEAASC